MVNREYPVVMLVGENRFGVVERLAVQQMGEVLLV